jgi:hypothetical protein
MKTTPFDTSWYVKQERKIAEADIRAAIVRRRVQAITDDGHVYVVEFTSGVVKVGKSTRPTDRLASHAKYAQIHGGDIRQSWISERHHGCSDTERKLIDLCKMRGEVVFGKEYFRGISFRAARDFADLATHLVVNAGQLGPGVIAAYHNLVEAGGSAEDGALDAWRRGVGSS